MSIFERIRQRIESRRRREKDRCNGCKWQSGENCILIRRVTGRDRRRCTSYRQWDDVDKLLRKEKREEWIPVTERLPELTKQVEGFDFCTNFSEDVLIWSPMNMIPLFEIGRYTDDRGWTDVFFRRKDFPVTHWMPLPKAPEV